MTKYIESFDALIYQLLTRDSVVSPSLLTVKFIDGLQKDIQLAIVIQRPKYIDTASSLALL